MATKEAKSLFNLIQHMLGITRNLYVTLHLMLQLQSIPSDNQHERVARLEEKIQRGADKFKEKTRLLLGNSVIRSIISPRLQEFIDTLSVQYDSDSVPVARIASAEWLDEAVVSPSHEKLLVKKATEAVVGYTGSNEVGKYNSIAPSLIDLLRDGFRAMPDEDLDSLLGMVNMYLTPPPGVNDLVF